MVALCLLVKWQISPNMQLQATQCRAAASAVNFKLSAARHWSSEPNVIYIMALIICGAKKPSGKACQTPVVPGTDFCALHKEVLSCGKEMNDQKSIRFDEDQLNTLIAAIRQDTLFGLSVDSMARFSQVLALIVAGAWILFVYLDHESVKHELEESKLQAAQLIKFNSSGTLSFKKLRINGRDHLSANLDLKLANTSEKPHDVSWSVIEYFTGKLRHESRMIDVINSPKPFSVEQNFFGHIKWERKGRYIHFAKHISPEERESAKEYMLSRGVNVSEETVINSGGLTGWYSANTSNWLSQRFLVASDAGDFFGISIVTGVDGGLEDKSRFYYTFEEPCEYPEDTLLQQCCVVKK